jgi:hypothetical protein
MSGFSEVWAGGSASGRREPIHGGSAKNLRRNAFLHCCKPGSAIHGFPARRMRRAHVFHSPAHYLRPKPAAINVANPTSPVTLSSNCSLWVQQQPDGHRYKERA